MIFGPRAMISPTSPGIASEPSSFTTRTSTPATGRPHDARRRSLAASLTTWSSAVSTVSNGEAKAIPLPKTAVEDLHRSLQQIRSDRRSAVGQGRERGKIVCFDIRLMEQEVDHRGNDHYQRYALA